MIKLKNATFAQAVRLQNNKMENFVTSEQAQFELFYKPEEQLLYVYHANGIIKLVGITNIVEMTLDKTEDKKAKKTA